MNSKDSPIEPDIEVDGYYLFCPTCGHLHINVNDERCVSCGQKFSWDWLLKGKDNG